MSVTRGLAIINVKHMLASPDVDLFVSLDAAPTHDASYQQTWNLDQTQRLCDVRCFKELVEATGHWREIAEFARKSRARWRNRKLDYQICVVWHYANIHAPSLARCKTRCTKVGDQSKTLYQTHIKSLDEH